MNSTQRQRARARPLSVAVLVLLALRLSFSSKFSDWPVSHYADAIFGYTLRVCRSPARRLPHSH
ncbi:hypothetical protein E2X65_22875 [Salmonella enterica]|nr:hypothetical protein [Salmonella enterica]